MSGDHFLHDQGVYGDGSGENVPRWAIGLQASLDALRDERTLAYEEIELTRPPLYGASAERLRRAEAAMHLTLLDAGLTLTKAADAAKLIVARLRECL